MSTKNQCNDVYIKFHRSILSRMCRICGFHSSDISSKNTNLKIYPTFAADASKQGVDISDDHVAIFPSKMCRWCKERADKLAKSEDEIHEPVSDLFDFVPHGNDCKVCKLTCPSCLLTNNPHQHRIKRNLSQDDTEYIDAANQARHDALQTSLKKFDLIDNKQKKKYPEHTVDCELCFTPCFTCGCHPKFDPKSQFAINTPEATQSTGRMRLRTRKRKSVVGSDGEDDEEPLPKQTIIHPLLAKHNGKLCNILPSLKIKPLELGTSALEGCRQKANQQLKRIKNNSALIQTKPLAVVSKPISIAAKTQSSYFPTLTTTNTSQSLKYRAIQIKSTQATTSNFTTFKNIGNVPTPISNIKSTPVIFNLTTGPSQLILQNVITNTNTSSAKQEIPILSTGMQNVDGKKYNIKVIPGSNIINNYNNILLNNIKKPKDINSTRELVTTIADGAKPPGSVEFGRVPHQVATAFHQIFVSHGSLTAAIKTTLDMRLKLRYKYEFIDQEKTKLCVLLGMPTSKDNLEKLQEQLLILDKYVKSNHLVSRAAAIEELLYSPKMTQFHEKKIMEDMSLLKLKSYVQAKESQSRPSILSQYSNQSLHSLPLHLRNMISQKDDFKTETNDSDTSDSDNQKIEKPFVRPSDNSHSHNLRKIIPKTKRYSLSPPREKNEIPKNKVLKEVMDRSNPILGYDVEKNIAKLLKQDCLIGCKLTLLMYHSFVANKCKQSVIYNTCYACGELVKQEKFAQHAWEHYQSNNYTCTNCKIKLTDLDHMKNHVIKRTCFKEDSQKPRMNPRPKNYTGIIPYYYRPFTVKKQYKYCNVCKYAVKDINLMTFHARQHVGDYPFRCAMCGFASVCKTRLTKHQHNVKHVGFLVIKRSTAPSAQLLKEVEMCLKQNILLFNHLGYIEENDENHRLRLIAENKKKKAGMLNSKQPDTNVTMTPKAKVIFPTPTQTNKGKKILPKPILPKPVQTSTSTVSNWTFCKVCNSGFLDKETYDLHKIECDSNTDSKEWIYEKSKTLLPEEKQKPVKKDLQVRPCLNIAATKNEHKNLPPKITSTSSLLGLATKLADRASILSNTTKPVISSLSNETLATTSSVSRRALRKQKPQKRKAKTAEGMDNENLQNDEPMENLELSVGVEDDVTEDGENQEKMDLDIKDTFQKLDDKTDQQTNDFDDADHVTNDDDVADDETNDIVSTSHGTNDDDVADDETNDIVSTSHVTNDDDVAEDETNDIVSTSRGTNDDDVAEDETNDIVSTSHVTNDDDVADYLTNDVKETPQETDKDFVDSNMEMATEELPINASNTLNSIKEPNLEDTAEGIPKNTFKVTKIEEPETIYIGSKKELDKSN